VGLGRFDRRFGSSQIPNDIRWLRGVAVLAAFIGSLWLFAAGPAGGAARGDRMAARGGRTPQFSAPTRRALNTIIASAMGAANQPGMVVGVWVPGRGSYVRAMGTSDLATGKPMSIKDHFRIASITKSFVAVAILRLVDQHKLSLDAHLATFVPGIPHGDQITIAQLLDMTSGIYDYVNDPALVKAQTRNPLRRFTLKDLVAIIRRHKPMFAPGSDAVYDNSNYYLAGAIAAKASGEPLGRLIKTEILDPLRMTHTSFPSNSAMPRPFSRGYIPQPNFALRDITSTNPAFAAGAGAMISTLRDLKIWAKALATGSLLSPAMRAAQRQTHVLSKSPTVTLSYGLGLTDINGLLGHDGAIDGYGSTMLYLPSRRATVIMLGNSNDFGSPVPLIPSVAIGAYLFPGHFPNGL
jgi:D-alanyl-D-alanine carboxypeptidase